MTDAWVNLVKGAMKERGINQKELSRLTGITESSISRYLKGERTPRIDIIVNFAKALDLDINTLLNESPVNNAYDELSQLIARRGKELTQEETDQLIKLLRGKELNV